jgi:D-glycero-alpha-D-manno-heptose-7-phosphate kinase
LIISRTPLRLSLAGGGTDYVPYLKSGNPGLVVGSTIDKYIYICLKGLPPFFEYKTQISYSRIEQVESNNDIQHKVFRDVIRYFGLEGEGLDITHLSECPSKVGVGSSSAFIVGLVNALHTWKTQNRLTGKELYDTSVHLEQNVLQESVGLQDSAWAAFGGLNYIRFAAGSGEPSVWPLGLKRPVLEELNNNLLLFFTGTTRTASQIASSYIGTLKDKKELQNNIYTIADKSIEALLDGDTDLVGRLMNQGWINKRALSPNISSSTIDELWKTCMAAGAIGFKLVGAGGGGCILVYAPSHKRQNVRRALDTLIEIPFSFESNGSQIIFQSE